MPSPSAEAGRRRRRRTHLHAPYNHPEAVRGLEDFSHLWLLFVFHQTMAGGWRPTVRPPRLGGNTRMGVFATRSTFRPNPLGMSLVELKGIRCEKQQVVLQLGSLDLVDGTPVIDIKPYLPFAEALPEARSGFARQAPAADMPVSFSTEARLQLAQHQQRYPHLERFITQTLAQDPRPLIARAQKPAASTPHRCWNSMCVGASRLQATKLFPWT